MQPMRIAYVVAQFPSVSETFIAAQLRGLRGRGHEVDVYAGQGGTGTSGRTQADCAEQDIYRPVQVSTTVRRGELWRGGMQAASCMRASASLAWWSGVFRFGMAPMLSAGRYAAALGLRRKRYDVIHAHFGPNGVTAAAMRLLGVLDGALAVTFHGYDLSAEVQKAGRHLYRHLFQDAQLCLPVTERWRTRLLELGCPAEKVRVHHMGVDCNEFAWVARERSAGSPVELITVARLVEKKGIEYTLRALATLPPECAYRYTIVGDGTDRDRLLRLAADLGIASRVQFAGALSHTEVRIRLAGADVAILTSHRAANGDEEGLPVVLMEAMATGMPVVSTHHSGIPELIADGVEGFLVPERDVTILAQRIASLIRDPHSRVAMGRAARHRVTQQHDHAVLITELETLLRSAAFPPHATAGGAQ
jgi:colanic acid/amylovoran biosynthesis glycosyltransferase